MAFVRRAVVAGIWLSVVALVLAAAHRLAWTSHPAGGVPGGATSIALSNVYSAANASASANRPGQPFDVAVFPARAARGNRPRSVGAASRPIRPHDGVAPPALAADLILAIANDEVGDPARQSIAEPAAPPRPLPPPPLTPHVLTPYPMSRHPTAPRVAARRLPAPAPPAARRRSDAHVPQDGELPGPTREERELWHEALKDLPPSDLRELLRLRQQLGGLWPPGAATPGESPPGASPPGVSPPGQPSSEDEPTLLDPGATTQRQRMPLERLPFDGASPSDDPDFELRLVMQETLLAIAQGRRAIIHNIANANTIGYKRWTIAFESALETAGPRPSAPAGRSPAGESPAARADVPSGRGTRARAVEIDPSPGRLRATSRPFDLAIDGDGYFQLVDRKDGTIQYTRSGRFAVDSDSRIVLQSSSMRWSLEPTITLPRGATEVHVGAGGEVRALCGESGFADAGALQLARFANPSALRPVGENLYERVAATGAADVGSAGKGGRGRIRQGMLEESNVDVARELDELRRLRRQQAGLEAAARILDEPETELEPAR